jgi:hypothetical protein
VCIEFDVNHAGATMHAAKAQAQHVQKMKAKRKHKVKQIIAYISTTYRHGKTDVTRNVMVQSALCACPISRRYSGSTITGKNV